MIAVLASRLDPEARALVDARSAAEAALLSAEDLGSPGWIFSPGDPADGMAVVEGRRVRTAVLRGVLTRRPAVVAAELVRIHPEDRSYVAAEMNAFLVAWLNALPCPVVNRPTPTSLCGPAWARIHWRAAAARAGIPWAEGASAGDAETVVVCGERVLFAPDTSVAAAARALAREAGVSLLAVRVRQGAVSGASVAPDLGDPELHPTLLDLFSGAA
jgi:hypothetical protein